MLEFDYKAPGSVAEAVALLARANGDAKPLAGGTDLLVQLREGQRRAGVVVDIKRIPELMLVTGDATTGVVFGAAVPCWRLAHEKSLAGHQALVDACKIIGGWQIQSRASVGGNLCNSSPAADSIPALMVLDAEVTVAGPAGPRVIPVARFCVGPGKNALSAGEFVVSLRLPPVPKRAHGSAYMRFIPRNEMDIAVVGVGAALELDGNGMVSAARIALGAVAPTPVLAESAAQWLVGQPANEASFTRAGELAVAHASPISDIRGPAEYRQHLVAVMTKRALAAAADRAPSAA